MDAFPVWLVVTGFAVGIVVTMLLLCDTFDGD